jgi:hypothetical protein
MALLAFRPSLRPAPLLASLAPMAAMRSSTSCFGAMGRRGLATQADLAAAGTASPGGVFGALKDVAAKVKKEQRIEAHARAKMLSSSLKKLNESCHLIRGSFCPDCSTC